MSGIVTPLKHWIANLAERYAGKALESIHHKLDKWLLAEAHRRLVAKKAPGVDGVTKSHYSQGLSQRLDDLVDRVRSQTYRAPPVRRVEIQKPDGGIRLLGIPTYEDKVLQKAFVMLVEPVFEREFLECSYGYRPGRTAHQAVASVLGATTNGHHWIIDMDIKKFFDGLPTTNRPADRHEATDLHLSRVHLLLGENEGWEKDGAQSEDSGSETPSGTQSRRRVVSKASA